MHNLSRVLVVSTLVWAAGCSSPEVPDFGNDEPDAANNSNANNNTPDMAANNNGSTPDMATEPDMAMEVDMAPDMAFERPDICTAHEECGPGWLCDIENADCVEGYNGKNGVFPDRLVTGIIADQSGPTGEVGRGVVAGIKAYFEHINTTRGGVSGRELELKVYNNNGDAAQGLQLLNGALGQREVFAFLGNQGDALAARTVDVFNQQKVVLFAPVSGGPDVRMQPPERYIFNYRVSYQEENARMVDFFVNEQNPPFPAVNFALFTEAEPGGALGELGSAGLAGMAQTLGADPHRIPEASIMRATYTRGTTNTTTAVESLMRWLGSGNLYEVDFMGYPGQIFAMIVLTAHDQPAADFMKRFKDDLGRIRNGVPTDYTLSQEEIMRIMSSHLLFGITSSAGDGLQQALVQADPAKYCSSEYPNNQSDMVLSQVVPFYQSNSTTVLRYREQLEAYDSALQPGFASLEGYIAARLYVEALNRAGEALTDDHFVDAIESIVDYNDLALAPTAVDFQDHQAMTEVFGTYLDQQCVIQEHAGSN